MKTLFTDNPTRTARAIYLAIVVAATAALTTQFILLQRQGDRITRSQVKQDAQIAANQHVALEAARALCLQKTELRSNVQGARQFLREHPAGTADFSRLFILAGIRDSEKQLAALSDIHCRSG